MFQQNLVAVFFFGANAGQDYIKTLKRSCSLVTTFFKAGLVKFGKRKSRGISASALNGARFEKDLQNLSLHFNFRVNAERTTSTSG
jgi:hypothetical protein